MLNQDFREFVELLARHDVRYLIVGGYSVALHGHPRYTKDLDIWVDPSPDNARRVYEALARFGAPLDQLTVHVQTRKSVRNVGMIINTHMQRD